MAWQDDNAKAVTIFDAMLAELTMLASVSKDYQHFASVRNFFLAFQYRISAKYKFKCRKNAL